MRITDQYFWNILFLGFFLCIVFLATVILESEAIRPYSTLTLVDYTLIVFASFRLIRLVVYDKITAFFREQFYNLVEYKGQSVLVKPDSGFRRTLADLISCPWCVGPWAVLFVSFFYLLTPYAVYPVFLLALSSVATFLQILVNMLGWKAEQLKRDVEIS